MKLNSIKLILAGFLFTSLLNSCSKSDDISNSVTSGKWKVSLFYDTGDETSNFSGYAFTFHDGGHLEATNGATTINGTWSQGSNKLIINFGTTPIFDDLNDDWLVEEQTSTSIKLKDDNPTQDDKLQFTIL